MRVEIWNLLNCSERDICNPIETMCFDNQELAKKYTDQFGNDTAYTVPCPPFDKSKYPQDESNKWKKELDSKSSQYKKDKK